MDIQDFKDLMRCYGICEGDKVAYEDVVKLLETVYLETVYSQGEESGWTE